MLYSPSEFIPVIFLFNINRITIKVFILYQHSYFWAMKNSGFEFTELFRDVLKQLPSLFADLTNFVISDS